MLAHRLVGPVAVDGAGEMTRIVSHHPHWAAFDAGEGRDQIEGGPGNGDDIVFGGDGQDTVNGEPRPPIRQAK